MRRPNVINAFTSGVISPRLSLRSDLRMYAQALRQAVNWIMSPHGGAIFRRGMQHIGSPASSAAAARIFTFRTGGDLSDYLVEIQAGTIRVWQDDATVFTSGTNEYSAAELADLYFTSQAKLGIICHGAHPPLYLTIDPDQTLGTIALDVLGFERVPSFNYDDVKSPQQTATAATWEITFPSTWGSSPYQYLVSYRGVFAETGEGVPIKYTWTNNSTTNASNIKAGLDNAIASLGYSTTTNVTASDLEHYTATLSGADSGWEVKIWPLATTDKVYCIQTSSDALAAEPAWSFPYVVTNGGSPNYYKCLAPHLSAAATEPGVGASWATVWEDLGTTAPAWWDWQHGSANAWVTATQYAPWDRGFPTVAIFHEQRLIFMANRDNPTTLYGSQIGDPRLFESGVTGDDPFIFVIDTADTPQIKWAHSQQFLLLGTSGGDFNVSAEVSLAPDDISVIRQNNARSYHTAPVGIETEVFYIEQGQTKLRVTHYIRDYQAFTSLDASLQAEHLLHANVKRLAIQYVPEVLVSILGEDGQLRFLTYSKLSEQMAWSEAQTQTGDTIVDIAGAFDLTLNEDVLYCLVERDSVYYLEKMQYPARDVGDGTGLSVQNIVHMDAYVTGTVSGSTITGLTHLEGMNVGIVLDDAWLENTDGSPFTVSGGVVTLPDDFTGAKYAVGIPYSGTLETFEIAENPNGGTAFGTKRRWMQLTTRMIDSALPKVFALLDSDRQPSVPMGTPDAVRIGLWDAKQQMLGFGDGSIMVIQDRPYPTHVLGLFGQYAVNEPPRERGR